MFQQIIVILVFLAAIIYLAYHFFPALFGKKKAPHGCSSCSQVMDTAKISKRK